MLFSSSIAELPEQYFEVEGLESAAQETETDVLPTTYYGFSPEANRILFGLWISDADTFETKIFQPKQTELVKDPSGLDSSCWAVRDRPAPPFSQPLNSSALAFVQTVTSTAISQSSQTAECRFFSCSDRTRAFNQLFPLLNSSHI